MDKILLLNKPFNVLCQFTDTQKRQTLSDFIDSKKYKDFYPAGRLDRDSEGLVMLTDNGRLQHFISHPKNKQTKTYWVQVEGEMDEAAINQLILGVELKDGITNPAIASRIEEPNIWPRVPPIRERKSIPTSWISLSISEGRNRQVRRMTAAVGFPTLRLIRSAIGDLTIDDLRPGETKTVENSIFGIVEANTVPNSRAKIKKGNYRSNNRKTSTKILSKKSKIKT